MASQQNAEGQNPSSSSISPLNIRSRRGSLASLSSRSQGNKELLTHVLDEIHSNASQSTNLTTFNDFASPPTAAKNSDSQSTTSKLVQQGVGNLFARFKSTASLPKPNTEHSPTTTRKVNSSQVSIQSRPSTPASPLKKRQRTSSLSSNTGKIVNSSPRLPGYDHDEVEHIDSEALSDQPNPPASLALARDLSLNQDLSQPQRPESISGETQIDEIQGHHSSLLSNQNLKDARPRTSGEDTKSHIESPEKTTTAQLPRPTIVTQQSAPGPSVSRIITHAQRLPIMRLDTPDTSSSKSKSPAPSVMMSTRASLDRRSQRTETQSPQSTLIHEMRRKVLSRDFWMKDENAKVCFRCGDSFSTFRRKHHCRTCGQIYDAKCTTLISGELFGHDDKLRVCKTCESIIMDDESSDYSEEDETSPEVPMRSIRFSSVLEEPVDGHFFQTRSRSPGGESHMESSRRPLSVRRKTIGMTEGYPVLTRPSSSRSLKTLGGRPRTASHRQHRSRHQHMRSLGLASEGNVPFYDSSNSIHTRQLPAFHTDAIIDPDLAPFLSDDGSSDEEETSIAGRVHGDSTIDHQAIGFGGLFSAMRKTKARPVSKYGIDHPARDADAMSITSARNGPIRHGLGNRTLSSGSLMGRLSGSPRIVRSGNLFTDYGLAHSWLRHEETAASSSPTDIAVTDSPTDDPVTSIAELSRSSLQHAKRLLRQLLQDSQVDNAKRWEKALLPILMRCAEEVDPNISRGDDIDIRHYMKFKKIAGGAPNDSNYISGVVFTKNIALKGMSRNIRDPRILILSFPLVYARHQQHFMSLEPVIAQEKEYLRNLVNRIAALNPNVVLVQRPVSGLAVRFLQEANITVAYNVKESVLQAVCRCTQTRIISSVDKLTMDPRHLGSCGNFEVKTYVHRGAKKSYIHISGCRKDLGCTIILRGANRKTLAKVKGITEFMCYAVYNAKLETSLLRDQFVNTTAIPDLNDVSSKEKSNEKYDDDKPPANESRIETNSSSIDRGAEACEAQTAFQISDTVLKKNIATNAKVTNGDLPKEHGKLLQELRNRILSISASVELAQPYLLTQGYEQEKNLVQLRDLINDTSSEKVRDSDLDNEYKFELVKPEAVYDSANIASNQVRNVLENIHHSEYRKVLAYYEILKRRWQAFTAGAINPFSPFSHQRIILLFSIVSTLSGNACEGPDLLGLDFYQEHDMAEGLEPDVPLGEYVERLCDQADRSCTAQRCEKKMIDHHRQYVHGDGQVSIHCEKMPSRIRGMESTILMWSSCKVCEQELPITPMSSNSWRYSFAKYLELSFWGKKMIPRTGVCPHDVARDHVRYFGFKNIAISVRYDSINIVEVIGPRSLISWKVQKDIQLKNAEFERIRARLDAFTRSINHRIDSIQLENVEATKAEGCKSELHNLRNRAASEHASLTKKLQDKYSMSQFFEIVPLNRAVRMIQENVAEWDYTFAEFEKNYLPSEKDITRLAAQQLKKMYLGQDQNAQLEGTDVESLQESGQEIPLSEKVNEVVESPGPLTENEQDASTIVSRFDQDHTLQIDSTDAFSAALSKSQHLDLAVPHPLLNSVGVSEEGPLEKQVLSGKTQSSQNNQVLDTLPSDIEGTLSSGPDLDTSSRRQGMTSEGRFTASPPLYRSRTQPIVTEIGNSKNVKLMDSTPRSTTSIANKQILASGIPVAMKNTTRSIDKDGAGDNPLTLAFPKPARNLTSSLIPRSVQSQKNSTKVSLLAKHFEQMSRAFEKERLRERRQRATRNLQARVYSTTSYRSTVEIFRDVREAVREKEPTAEIHHGDINSNPDMKGVESIETLNNDTSEVNTLDDLPADAEDDKAVQQPGGDVDSMQAIDINDVDANLKDADSNNATEEQEKPDADSKSPTEHLEALDIPKHDKNSLMKLLTSFWSERSAIGWAPLEYPLAVTDHIFADSDIIVREDEPSSLIAFSLASNDYETKLRKLQERVKPELEFPEAPVLSALDNAQVGDVEKTLLGKTATHLKYQFQAGSARMQCKVFYAESFDAIRQKCGVSERFVESLSRCLKWDLKGGKSKSIFLKTLDERFVLKSLSAVETQAFLRFAPEYFDYMSKCLFHNLPSALAKMLGFYQISIKNPVTGIEFNSFLQVMENVFYEGPSNRMFDLKGSMRNRRVESTGEKNEVLLDENMLDYITSTPMYIRNHSNNFLASSISNDTLFCSKQNVMDYSLIVGLYDDRPELMVGIIDYIRTYTWDKKLESWIKDRGKHKPTVRSPKDYRNRFRASISRYLPLAPSCWQVFGTQRPEQYPAWWEASEVEDDTEDEHGHDESENE